MEVFPSSLSIEPFVNAERAALFLDMPRKTLLGLARRGNCPLTESPEKGGKRAGVSASLNSISGCGQR